MTTARELLQLARKRMPFNDELGMAIDAFLAQPEPEPVMKPSENGEFVRLSDVREALDELEDRFGPELYSLGTVPDLMADSLGSFPRYAAQPEPAAKSLRDMTEDDFNNALCVKPEPSVDMLDLTPVGPGRTVDDALSEQSAEVERIMAKADEYAYEYSHSNPEGAERMGAVAYVALRAEVELLADEAHDWKFKAKRLETLARENLERAEAAELQLKMRPAPMADCPVYCKTAVELKERAERNERTIEQAARIMRGEGVQDQGEAYDQALCLLDAAIAQEKP